MPKIAIIGGGIMGSSIAWNLAKAVAKDDLLVIEPDPTYQFAATPRAVGGIRFVQGLKESGYDLGKWDHQDSLGFNKIISWSIDIVSICFITNISI